LDGATIRYVVSFFFQKCGFDCALGFLGLVKNTTIKVPNLINRSLGKSLKNGFKNHKKYNRNK
jgi:hypothetical protein